MKRNRRRYRRAGAVLLGLLLGLCFSISALAENLPCRSATATGLYRHPVTGVIEDSGGDDSEALGQSMVTNVVDTEALLEERPSGGYYLSLRFHLTDNLSEIHLSVQEPGDSAWTEVSYTETGSGDDQKDLRLPIDSEETIVRAECYVDAMGRSVIFFVTLSDFTDGNAGGFAQTDESDADAGSGTDGSASDSGVLDGVTGLTTGGTAAASQNTETTGATLSADTGEVSDNVQQLNLSGGVWWMMFVVIFCANLLAGLVLLAVKTLVERLLKRDNRAYEEDAGEDEDGEDTFDDLELLEDDWEEAEDEKRG